MNHRERVWLALNHQQPDRCPLQVGFTPEFAARLRPALRLEDRQEHNPHGGGNVYELERTLDQDLLFVDDSSPMPTLFRDGPLKCIRGKRIFYGISEYRTFPA